MKTKSVCIRDIQFGQKFYDVELCEYTKVVPVTPIFNKSYCYAMSSKGLHCFELNVKVLIALEPVDIDSIKIGEKFQIANNDKTFIKVDVKNNISDYGMCDYQVEMIEESLVYRID